MSINTAVPAAHLILIKDNEVLLLRRANTGYEDGNYSTIAGHVDEGETFMECLIREAQEEAGILILAEDVQFLHAMYRNSQEEHVGQRMDLFFTAKTWVGEIQNTEPHKCDDLSWFSLDKLPENIIPYLQTALESIRAGIAYGEFGWKKGRSLEA